MNKLLIAIFLFFNIGIARSQELIHQIESSDSLSVHFIPLDKNQFDPGELVFISALVNNDSSQQATVQFNLDLPDGWTLLYNEDDSLILAPQESYVYLNAIQIPTHTPVDSYLLKLSLKEEERDDNEVCADHFILQVGPLDRLQFAIDKVPPILGDGESFTFLFHYINEGNSHLPLQVEIKSDFAWEEQMSYFISLDPGEKKDQEIKINAQSKANPKECAYVFIKLRHGETGELLDSRTLIFDILPLGTIWADPYIKMPSTFRLTATKQGNEQAVFAEIEGEGIIDYEKDISNQFFLQVPLYRHHVSTDDITSFYWNLDAPDWELKLGDNSYSLGALSEDYWYARGGMFALYREHWEAGSFYAQDVLHEDCRRKEIGTFFNVTPHADIEIGTNYLYKQYGNRRDAHIGEVDLELHLLPTLSLTTNLARNFNSKSHKNGYSGYRIELSGNGWNKNSFSLERLYVGKRLGGYYDGINQTSGYFDQPLNLQYSLNVGFNLLRYSLNQTCYANFKFAKSKMNQQSLQAQLNYVSGTGFSSALTGFYFRMLDPLKRSRIKFQQYWGGLNLGYTQSYYFLLFTSSFGTEQDRKRKYNNKFLQRYSFNINCELPWKLQLNLFFEFGNINLLKAHAWRYAIGSQLSWQLNQQTSITAFIQTNRFTLLGSWNNRYALSIKHTFANKHQLTFDIQQIHYPKHHCSNETQFLLTYTIPFDLRVMKRKDQGVVTGRLYQAYNKEPISHAIIRVNDQAILTDQEGHFSFQGIPNGNYQFKTEKLLRNQVTPYSEFSPISVKGGRTTFIDVPVYQKSMIEGEVRLFNYQDVTQINDLLEQLDHHFMMQPVYVGKMENIPLTLQHLYTGQVLYCLADAEGHFCFSEIYPGDWQLFIAPEELPEGYKLVSPLTVQVRENQVYNIHVDLLPTMSKEIQVE